MRSPIVKYLIDRLIFTVIAYFVAVTIGFAIPRLVPGSPLMGGSSAPTPIDIHVYRRLMGYCTCTACTPLCIALCDYFTFLYKAFTGDLGISLSHFPRRVLEVIGSALPYTLILLVPAIAISWLLGNMIGARIAYRRHSIIDTMATTVSVIVSQMPFYITATLLLYFFGLKLRILPIGNAWSPGLFPSLSLTFVLDFLWHYILPFTSLLVTLTGVWIIRTRFSVVSELESEYIVFSENMGLKDSRIVGYIARSGMLAQVAVLAVDIGLIIAGQVLVEKIYNYPGMGYVVSRAMSYLDYPLIDGIFIILSLTVFVSNYIVDIIYVLVDPRIRLGEQF